MFGRKLIIVTLLLCGSTYTLADSGGDIERKIDLLQQQQELQAAEINKLRSELKTYREGFWKFLLDYSDEIEKLKLQIAQQEQKLNAINASISLESKRQSEAEFAETQQQQQQQRQHESTVATKPVPLLGEIEYSMAHEYYYHWHCHGISDNYNQDILGLERAAPYRLAECRGKTLSLTVLTRADKRKIASYTGTVHKDGKKYAGQLRRTFP